MFIQVVKPQEVADVLRIGMNADEQKLNDMPLKLTWCRHADVKNPEHIDKTDYKYLKEFKTEVIPIWHLVSDRYAPVKTKVKYSRSGTLQHLFGDRRSKQYIDSYPVEEQKNKVSWITVVDYDHLTDGQKKCIESHLDEIGSTCTEIIMYQKSHSGNVHFYCVDDTITTFEEYKNRSSLHTAHIAEAIFEITGIDLRISNDEGKLLDTHNTRITQPFVYTENPFFVNMDFKLWDATLDDIQRLETDFAAAWVVDSGSFDTDIRTTSAFTGKRYSGSKLEYPYPQQDRHIKAWVVASACYELGVSEGQAGSLCAELYVGNPELGYDWCRRTYHGGTKANSTYRLNQWLQSVLGLEIKTESKVEKKDDTKQNQLFVNDYLDEYYDTIRDSIDMNKTTMVVAPTGIGKTVTIRRLSKERKCIVVVPFNSLLQLYDKQLDNNGNLVEEATGVIVSSSNNKELNEDITNIMVWDQFVKWYSYIESSGSWTIVVDESHLIFRSRSYRKAASMFAKMVNELLNTNPNNRLLLVTATPTAEDRLFSIDNRLDFIDDRRTICPTWIKTKNVIGTICSIVDKADCPTITFTNRYAQTLRETLLVKFSKPIDEVCLMHSLYQDTDLFKKTKETEMLAVDTTIVTEIGYCGLNIRNTGKVICVVVKEQETDAPFIIQSFGRLRNADVETYVIEDLSTRESATVDERKAAYDELVAYNGTGLAKTLVDEAIDETLSDPDYVEALREIETYNNTSAPWNTVLAELSKVYYIGDIKIVYGDYNYERPRRWFKQQKSNEFKQWYLGLTQTKPDDSDIIIRQLSRQLEALRNGWNDLPAVSDESIRLMVEASPDECLMETILDHIKEIVKVWVLPDDEKDELKAKPKEYILKHFGTMSKLTQRKLLDKFNRKKKIIESYEIHKTKDIDLTIDDFLMLTGKELSGEKLEIRKKKAKGGHAVGGTKNKKRVLYKGTVYESQREMARKINVNEKTVRNWMKAGCDPQGNLIELA